MALYDNKSNQVNWREQHLYGSSRIGMWTPNVNLANNNAVAVWDTLGHKQYELNNHLGNVLATVSDIRIPVSTDGITTSYYLPDVTTAQDYYGFGGLMPGRTYTENSVYRYGFNGKENDNEVKGDGNQQDYGMRIYDPRLGRFLSVDPLQVKYPELTPYQFASNTPIQAIDLDGKEAFYVHGTWSNPSTFSKLSITKIDHITENTSHALFKWSGNNEDKDRRLAAVDLANFILKNRDTKQPLTIVGHSHGGSVAIMAANILKDKGVPVDYIITINTPSREYQLKPGAAGKHVQIYTSSDPVQGLAGNNVQIPDGFKIMPMHYMFPMIIPTFGGAIKPITGEMGSNISRTFDDATNILVPQKGPMDFHNSHNDPDLWKQALYNAIHNVKESPEPEYQPDAEDYRRAIKF